MLPKISTIEINPKTTPRASVIWLHGLGADSHDFLDIVPELALPDELGIRFIFPDAPLRAITFANGEIMRAWFDIKELNAENANIDITGIREAERLVANLIEHEMARGIASNRIILAGFSQGGTMALQCGLRFPNPLAGILVLSGFLPLAERIAHEKNCANQKTPILMLHGTEDQVIPINWAKCSYEKLIALGFTSRWQTYPMAHAVCPSEIKTIATWIFELLKMQSKVCAH